MPTYIALYKLTDQGIKDIKNAPVRIKEGIKNAEKMGAKVLGFYTVMGEYDYVSIGEFPDDEGAMALNLALGAKGYVRTTSLKAFTADEFEKIIKKLP